jgi:hypothetical protein
LEAFVTDNYKRIVLDNLGRFYQGLTDEKIGCLPATRVGEAIAFRAFGDMCRITPDAINLGNEAASSVMGILISLYALHASPEPCTLEPVKAFKDFPDSMPYASAFSTHTEHTLIPHVERIRQARDGIMEALQGREAPKGLGGDFSFLVHPLPKIALCYIFYEADDEFPASATCVYSNNALSFIPIDGLADVGEYTSKKIIDLLK